MTIRITDFDTATLDFEHVTIKKTTCILPRLKTGEQTPTLETPWIELTHYGIPKANDYFRTDKDRMFIQVPVERDSDMFTFFTSIDTLMESEEMQTKLFQDSKGYTYKPIIKPPSNDQYPAHMKAKLIYDADNNICTDIYEAATQIQVKTIEDVCKAVPYKSNVKMLLRISKVWVINKAYGITLKAYKIRVKHTVKEKPSLDFLDE